MPTNNMSALAYKCHWHKQTLKQKYYDMHCSVQANLTV